MNEIQQNSKLTAESFITTFNFLIDAGVLAVRSPIFSKILSGTRSYYIALPLFAFWSYFVGRNGEIPEKIAIANECTSDNKLSTYLGHCFEQICMDYLLNRINSRVLAIGYWSDKITINDSDKPRSVIEEIDICISLAAKLILGECKWQTKPIDKNVVDTLIRRAAFVDNPLPRELYFFSRSGFTNTVLEMAEADKSLHLVNFEDMFDLLSSSKTKIFEDKI